MSLKKCCKKEPDVMNVGVGEADMYIIKCEKCNKGIMYNGDWEDAEKKWNRRKVKTDWL